MWRDFFHLPIRRFESTARGIYLTFDDGPDPVVTPKLLSLLDKHRARATFFLVGRAAEKNPQVAREILAAGHAIGNHTYDHDYRRYFSGQSQLEEWVVSSETKLRNLLGSATVGFRPPAGVLTPPLLRAVRAIHTPLYLWRHRFFDTRRPFTRERAEKAARHMAPGDIVLLHDANNSNPQKLLEGVERFLNVCEQPALALPSF